MSNFYLVLTTLFFILISCTDSGGGGSSNSPVPEPNPGEDEDEKVVSFCSFKEDPKVNDYDFPCGADYVMYRTSLNSAPRVLFNVKPEHFKRINSHFAIANNSLFYTDLKMPWIDIDSLEFLSDWVVKDKNFIYWLGYEILMPSNSSPTFKAINENLFTLNDILYVRDRKFEGPGPSKIKTYKDNSAIWNYENKFFHNSTLFAESSAEIEFLGGGYAKIANSIYHQSYKVQLVDLNSFEVISNDLARDKNYIFSRHNITDYDPLDYKSFENAFYRSSGKIYYGSNQLPDDVDVDTFEVINSSQYARDKNKVYFRNEFVPEIPVSATFKTSSIDNSYHLVDGKLYDSSRRVFESIEGMESSDIHILPNLGIQYENKLYSSDGKTIILDNIATDKPINSLNGNLYEYDGFMYFKEKIFENTKMSDIKVIDYRRFLKNEIFYDFSSSYSGPEKLTQYDHKDFKMLHHSFIYSGGIIYRYDREYANIGDLNNFHWVEYGYSFTDGSKIYRGTNYVHENILHPKEFTFLYFQSEKGVFEKSGYAFDGEKYYYNYEPIDLTKEQLAGFTPIHFSYAKSDLYRFYQGNLISDVDLATFQFLGGIYSKDKNSIFVQGKPITGPDVASFQSYEDSYYFFKDNSNAYSGATVLTGVNPNTFKPGKYSPTSSSYWGSDGNVLVYKDIVVTPENFDFASLRYTNSGANDNNNTYSYSYSKKTIEVIPKN